MITKQVTVSGAVGKQAIPSTQQVVLHGFLFRAATGVTATCTIRDGNASGDVIADVIVPSNNSHDFNFQGNGGVKFTKGMHVKVIGTNAAAYLYLT